MHAARGAAATPGGPAGWAQPALESVVSWLDGPEAMAADHAAVEQRLTVDEREQFRLLYQGHLDERAAREARRRSVVGSDGTARPRVEHGHQRQLTTVFGSVTVTRMAYRATPTRPVPGAMDATTVDAEPADTGRVDAVVEAAPTGTSTVEPAARPAGRPAGGTAGNLYPADAVLNLPVGRHSAGLARLAAVEAARGSFEDAGAAIERTTGVRLGKRQVELLALYALSPREREVRTATFKAKLGLFRFAENFQAIFGADRMGLSWSDAVTYRQAILLDFCDIHSPQVKKFCLLWIYALLLTFIKQRGHGRHLPISLIIDELSYFVGTAAMNTDLLTADLDELINRISRSHAIWLTLAGQELFQLPEQLRQTVLSTGTVLFGQTSNYQAAEELARRWYRYDPYLVKKREFFGGRPGRMLRGGFRERDVPPTEHTTEFTRDEQNYLHSRPFLELPAFHFLLGHSPREGQLPTTLAPISTARLDPGQFPDKRHVDRIRSQLMQRDGASEQALLAQIQRRTQSAAAPAGPERSARARPQAAARPGGMSPGPPAPPKVAAVAPEVPEAPADGAAAPQSAVAPDQPSWEDQLISRQRPDEQEPR